MNNEDAWALQRGIEESKRCVDAVDFSLIIIEFFDDRSDYLEEILRFETAQRSTPATADQRKEAAVDDARLIPEIERLRIEEDNNDFHLDTGKGCRNDTISSLSPENTDAYLVSIPLVDELTEDLFRAILLCLDEDSIGYCICTCKAWNIIKNEHMFEHLCRRIYPIQARVPASQLELRKHTSWFGMFAHRPRVRYNGMYVLRVAYCKRPERSMFTELPPNAILEVGRYYRFHHSWY